jgi:hypothetical protein
MHYFELRNIQHFVAYFFPAYIFVFLFAAGLAFSHFKTKKTEQEGSKVYYTFSGGIQDREGPFPLVLILTILGTVLWALAYILAIGFQEVKI